MKPVVQDERAGCGIASVAMLAGVTYRQVRGVARGMGISAADSRLWSITGYVRRLLTRYGIRPSAGQSPFASWERLPPVALLAIKWYRKGGRKYWHWVVFRRGPQGPVVLDPKRASNTRTEGFRPHEAQVVHHSDTAVVREAKYDFRPVLVDGRSRVPPDTVLKVLRGVVRLKKSTSFIRHWVLTGHCRLTRTRPALGTLGVHRDTAGSPSRRRSQS